MASLLLFIKMNGFVPSVKNFECKLIIMTHTQTIAILGVDALDSQILCRAIEEGPYFTKIFDSLENLKNGLASESCLAAFLDIDSVPLDNRTIRRLTLSFPSVCFFCTSRDRFHPDLKEAICYHLFACLNKPVDPDELHYFLRCIRGNTNESPEKPA
jgi:hypothetical protein